MNRPAELLASTVLIATLAGCGGEDVTATPGGLESVAVERGDLISSVAATGTIEPIRVLDVKSQASGEILEVGIEIGDHVERGTLLVRIDPRDVRNAFDQAEADLEVARARLTIAERQLERVQSLHDSAVVTDEELEGAILEHANARAALVRADANLELAADRLEDVIVRAPITGTVVEKNVEEGQIVTSTREVTGGTTLARMADLAEVQVRMLVDETDIGRVSEGLPATIRVEAYPDREFQGTVLKVEPQAVVEQSVTMFAVLTRIRNEDDLLRPGMNADVEVVVGRRQAVLALPNGAIKTPDEARELARVLDIELPAEADPASSQRDESGNTPDELGGEGPDGAGTREDDDDLVDRMRRMSPEQRREYFQGLDPAERRRLMEQARAARDAGEAAERLNPGRPRPAYVFRTGDDGALTAHPIVIGLTTWERTEVASGLGEEDEVLLVPQALVQQRELLERIRSRTGLPGVQRR